MKKSTIYTTTAVGAFVILTIAALFFLGFKASSLGAFNPKDVYHLNAVFGDVGGLGKDARVSIAGVQIGRVEHIQLQENKAIVRLVVDSKFKIPVDSSAQILTSGLLGERYIGINSGVENKYLSDGQTLAKSGASMVLEKVLAQFAGGESFYPDKTYELKAKFSDIAGITIDTPVKQSGVQIGRVSAIKLDQKIFQALVTMEIDQQYAYIPDDSSADVLSNSLIGGKYIGITPGGSDVYLANGDEFQYTNSAVVLEKLIQQFISNMTMKKD